MAKYSRKTKKYVQQALGKGERGLQSGRTSKKATSRGQVVAVGLSKAQKKRTKRSQRRRGPKKLERGTEALRRYGSHTVKISHPEKVLFPESGITKGDLIDYYERIADIMLPHVRDRVVAMHRFPDGIAGEAFYQKEVPDYFPDWIDRINVKKEGGSLEQLMINNPETLVYLANQACITPHIWPALADRLHYPDRVIFDFDPSNGAFGHIREGAKLVRDLLESVGLKAFVMTTGSRGLHIVAPLDRKADFDTVRNFARQVAEWTVSRQPERFTIEQRKEKRGERVFVDYLRNSYAQHGVAPYAVRAKPGAPVATPLDWDELGKRGLHPRKYTLRNLFKRLADRDDPWKEIKRYPGSVTRAEHEFAALTGAR
jgi:bifunctional non-homologous end joining protein LigD